MLDFGHAVTTDEIHDIRQWSRHAPCPMIVIADTSGLVAAFYSADPEHLSARQSLVQAALTVER